MDRNTKGKKANNLASNILANEDEEVYRQRNQWNQVEKLDAPESGWNSQQNMKKVTNVGGVDPYRQRQNQLGSSALEQTDYSNYVPVSKKKYDFNELNKQPEKTDPVKPVTDINYERERRQPLNVQSAKQDQLRSNFDEGRVYPKRQQEDEGPVASPVKGKYETQNRKLNNLTSQIGTLNGANANQYYHKNMNTGEIVDINISGLPSHADEIFIKRIA